MTNSRWFETSVKATVNTTIQNTTIKAIIKTTIYRNVAFIVVKILIVEKFHEKNDYKSDKVVHIVVFFRASTEKATVAEVARVCILYAFKYLTFRILGMVRYLSVCIEQNYIRTETLAVLPTGNLIFQL